MSLNFKRVPAIDKCFAILALFAKTKRPYGFNEIVRILGLNKSTVFNILHTLNDLDILEKGPDGRFRLGPGLYVLGNAAAGEAELIRTVHPYLESINREFKFSCFFGILSGRKITILDKADRAQTINVSSEIGMRIPIFAGAAGKALLSQFDEAKIDEILRENKPKKYTPLSITDINDYKREVMSVKKNGIAYDKGEYIEELISVSVPIRTYRDDLQSAIWCVGFKQGFREDVMAKITEFLLNLAKEINSRFTMVGGPFNGNKAGRNI